MDEEEKEREQGQGAPAADGGGEPKPETDWKAMSRKWEARAKENERKAAEFDAMKAKADEAEGKAATLEHERDVARWREEAAAKAGVPASILRGDTPEEIEAHANAVKAAMPSPYPTVPGGTPAQAEPMTVRDILAIKNTKERKRAILENIELFG